MAPAASKNGRVFWSAAVVVIVLDFVTKRLAERFLVPHVPRAVLGRWARLTLAHNPGAAFSMSLGQNSRWIFAAFAVAALFIVHRLYRHTIPGHTARALALGLVFGGAAGNLIDRFRGAAGVVDFIDIGIGDRWRFWTFNVADSGVTIGAIVLAWVLWQEDRREAAMKVSDTKVGLRDRQERA